MKKTATKNNSIWEAHLLGNPLPISLMVAPSIADKLGYVARYAKLEFNPLCFGAWQ